MNPAIVIPSYWTERDESAEIGRVGAYDHATAVLKPLPELESCLDSLEMVRGVLRVIVLLVASGGCEDAARARVDGICRMHPDLHPLVVGAREAGEIARAVDRVAPGLSGDPISLRGYGAIRNMGLAACAVLGHDVAVFLDDDEVVLDEDFLLDATYGLGMETRQGLSIYAKSGYFIDREDSPFAAMDGPRLRDRFWAKREEFNEWMHRALSATRISRSNSICGGCFAITAEAYASVAFDPTITRGEDLDYLLNLRMLGLDVWFDNKWHVRHLPPEMPSRAARFLQDVYRWEYELAKLDRANATIGMHQVRPESLRPYPAIWFSPEVHARIALTALMRAIFGPERLAYLRILLVGRLRARRWARRVSGSYFEFQTYWPRIMGSLWQDTSLARRLLHMGRPTPATRPQRQDCPPSGETADA